MKKVISLLLVCLMMLSMVTVASAANVVTVSVDAVDATTASEDDIIVVPVKMDAVPDGQVRTLGVEILYDATKLTYVKATNFDQNNKTVKALQLFDTDMEDLTGASFSMTANANSGKITLAWQNGGANQYITEESIGYSSALTFLQFNKVPGAKGTANFDVIVVGMVDNVTGGEYSLENTPEIIKAVDGSVKLSEVYSATVGTVENGTVTLDVGEKNPVELDAGDVVTINATPATGYELEAIKVNGAVIGGNTYTIVDTNAEITATFKPMNIAINYPTVDGITWESSPVSAPYGSEVTIVPTLANKYQLTALAADGVDILATKKFTVNTTSAIAITAEATYIPGGSTVTASSGTGYTVDGTGTYTEGDTVNIEVTPATGYTVEVTATGITLPAPVGNVYTFTAPDGDVAINVVATAIVYDLAATVSVSAELEAAADITFEPTTAILNEKVTVKVMPKDATYSIDPNAVKILKSNGDVVDGFKIVNEAGVELKAYGYEYEFTMPADGVVTLAMEGATLSADASLTSVEIGYIGNVGSVETPTTKTATVSATTTLINLDVFADPDYGDNFITVTPTVAANATYEVLYGDVAYTNNLELGTTTEEFKIKVTAQDGKTTKTYTVKVKNSTDPEAGATIEFVATPNLSVAKGSSVTVSILAKGLQSYGTTGLDLEIALPKAVILNNGDEFSVDVHEGAGIVNTMNTITYDEATGILKVIAVSTGTETLADNCEVAVVTFTVDPETTATKLVIGDTGSKGELGNGQDVLAIPMTVVPGELEITANMVDVQADAIEEIENYVDERNYTVEKWEEEVLNKIDEIIEEILESTTPEETATALAEGKAELDAFQQINDYTDKKGTDDTADDEAKEGFKTVISKDANILNGVDAVNYTTEDWAAIEAIVDEAQANIAASGSREEDILNGYVLDAQAKIAEVATLADRKAAAKEKLVVDEAKYTVEALANEIPTAITAAEAEIDAAATQVAIDAAVTKFLTVTVPDLDARTTTAPETNAYDNLNSVTVEKAQAEKDAYLAKKVDDVLALKTADAENDLYTDEAKAKIEIYELIAQAKIAATNSEATMNAAIDEALAKIALVPTVDDAAGDALEKISVNEKTGYDIEDIVATTVDNVNPAKEALYEAAIEAFKAANGIPGDDPADPVILTLAQLQGIINDTNSKITTGPSLLGDFTCNDIVDIQDPTGTMSYVCNKPIENYVVGAQNILNADLHTPGDGVLTVFDVVEIMKLL